MTRKVWTVGAALVAVLLGTAGKMDKLADYERDHYGALVVWFEDEKKETKEWLKLKTPQERDQWLKDKGYWNHFYKYGEVEREEILAREPKIGWTQDMVYMAWGAPYRKTKSTKRTAQDTTILTYRLIVDKDGKHRIYKPKSKETYKAIKRYQAELTMDERVLTEMNEKDGWQ
jgi:hypothetical protein